MDLFKASSIVISRAGAGTVSELLALEKPSLFIPLKIAQKNEQLYNAIEAKKKCGSEIIEEDHLNTESFLNCLSSLEKKGNDKSMIIEEQLANGQEVNKTKELIFSEIGSALRIS